MHAHAPTHCKLHIPPTNNLSPSCLTTARQKQQLTLNKLIKLKISWKKRLGEWTITENNKTERASGLGRKTREEIGKGNQMTAMIFHTGVRQTSLTSVGVVPC